MESGDPLVVCGPGSRITAWSPAAEAFTGLPASEALGMRCWEAVGGVDAAGAPVCRAGCGYGRRALAGRPLPAHEMFVRSADGGRRRVRASMISLSEAEGGGFAIVMQDQHDPAGPVDPGAARLTARQREVLALLAEGLPVRAVAQRLGLSESTSATTCAASCCAWAATRSSRRSPRRGERVSSRRRLRDDRRVVPRTPAGESPRRDAVPPGCPWDPPVRASGHGGARRRGTASQRGAQMEGSSFVRRHAATFVIGGVALVVAGAGGAVAQQVIDGRDIAPHTVGARQLATGAVGPRQLHEHAVGAEDLAAGAVNRSKVANGAIGAGQIAKGAVTPAKLASGAVNTGSLAPKAVTRIKLAADARVPVVVTRFLSHDVAMGTQDTLLVRCHPGETLISGGFGGVPTTVTAAGTQATILASRPEPDIDGSSPQAWMVIVDNHSTSLATTSAYAICAVP